MVVKPVRVGGVVAETLHEVVVALVEPGGHGVGLRPHDPGMARVVGVDVADVAHVDEHTLAGGAPGRLVVQGLRQDEVGRGWFLAVVGALSAFGSVRTSGSDRKSTRLNSSHLGISY